MNDEINDNELELAQRKASRIRHRCAGQAAGVDAHRQLDGRRGIARLVLAAEARGWTITATYWLRRGFSRRYHVQLAHPGQPPTTVEMVLPTWRAGSTFIKASKLRGGRNSAGVDTTGDRAVLTGWIQAETAHLTKEDL